MDNRINKMDVVGIHHVTLYVSDVTRACDFYGRTLGLTEVPRPDWFDFKGSWFAIGRQQIHLVYSNPLPPRTTEHVCLQVTDLAVARSQLESQGVVCKPDRDFHGTSRFVIHDPDGNYIEISEITEPWPDFWPQTLPAYMRKRD